MLPDFHAADFFSFPPFFRLCRNRAFLFFRCSSFCANFHNNAFFVSAYSINAHGLSDAFSAAHASGLFANACGNRFGGNCFKTKTFKADFFNRQDAIEYSIRFRHDNPKRSNRHNRFRSFRDGRSLFFGRNGRRLSSGRDSRDASGNSDVAGFAGARHIGNFRR